VSAVPRGAPCRWRWRVPPSFSSEAGPGEIIYLPVKGVEGLNVADCVEVYDYEVEALRLVHVEGLTTDEAAARLGMSKATFWRVLESCRFKVAQALTGRKPIKLVSSSLREDVGKQQKSL
jgi:predicted DNA-binding protein (UPF0251 family)